MLNQYFKIWSQRKVVKYLEVKTDLLKKREKVKSHLLVNVNIINKELHVILEQFWINSPR